MIHTKDVSNWEQMVRNRFWREKTDTNDDNVEDDENNVERKDDSCNKP